MKKLLLMLICSLSLSAHEMIIKESSCSVDETMQRMEATVKSRGLRVFAIIDHKKNADSVNMIMPDSKLIIFGNPKIGTPFMLNEMKTGLDLPMKILVYKDTDSKVKILYRDGTWLAKTHNLAISSREEKINKAMNTMTDKARTCTKD